MCGYIRMMRRKMQFRIDSIGFKFDSPKKEEKVSKDSENIFTGSNKLLLQILKV